MRQILNSILIISSALFAFVKSEDCKSDPKVAECEASVSEMVKAQLRHIDPCIKELGYKTGLELSDGTYCVMKCLMIKEGLLTSDGKLDKTNAANALISSLPDFLVSGTLEKLEKCGSANEGLLDNNEKSCKSYEGILNCVMETIPKLCNGDMWA